MLISNIFIIVLFKYNKRYFIVQIIKIFFNDKLFKYLLWHVCAFKYTLISKQSSYAVLSFIKIVA